MESRNCTDSTDVKKSEHCYECIEIENCYNCQHLESAEDSRDCYYSYGLDGCKDCFFSSNLKNKKYYIFNIAYDSITFESKKTKLLSKSKEECMEVFRNVKIQAIRQNLKMINSERSIGNMLTSCNNCVNIFY